MKFLKKFFSLMSKFEQRKFYLLMVLILVVTFVDIAGVASIFPFLMILANPEIIQTNKIFYYFYLKASILGVDNFNEFIFLIGFSVFFLLLITLFLRAITAYLQVRFVTMREYEIGTRLFSRYIYQPYDFFLNRNISDFSRIILSELNHSITQVLLPLINLIAQSTLVISLFFLIFIINPMLSIMVGLIFLIGYGGSFFFTKNYLSVVGSARQVSNNQRFAALTETFSAFREIKIAGLEKFFINRFEKSSKIIANNLSSSSLIANVPRYILEGIAFGGMIILILLFISDGKNLETIIPIITLYAFVGYRMLPAVQQIYVSLVQLRFSKSSLDLIYEDIVNLTTVKAVEDNILNMPLKKNISLKNINFSYPGRDYLTLKDISLKIPVSSKVAIIGETGCGKTTILNIILGLLNPIQGDLYVDDNIINNNNKQSWQKNIGYVPQKIYLSNASVSSNIAFGVVTENIDRKQVEHVAKIVNLHNFIMRELPDNYNTFLGENGLKISGGQQQRLGIARALYHKPKVLILDEATNALDSFNEEIVMEAINKLDKNMIVIMVTHRINSIKHFNDIFFIEKGQLKANGTYSQLLMSNESFKKILGKN